MIKKTILSFLFGASALACVCEPVILNTFMTIDKEIIANNLVPLNSNLGSYADSIKGNTKELEKLNAEYKRLAEHEAALSLLLEQQLFELQKTNAVEANRNRAIASEIQAILKQNENAAIHQQRLLGKERY